MANRSKAREERVTGHVVSVNFSPKGHIEGAVVETATLTVQLNIPKDSRFHADLLRVGSQIDVLAKEDSESAGGHHPVFEMAEPKGHAGVVARFNFARHGEVNGYQLDDGTFVHVKPDGAKRLKVQLGDRITASGRVHSGDAALVIDATHVVRSTAS